MGSSFSRHRSVKFHPSVKISIFQCKIGQPFGEFTSKLISAHSFSFHHCFAAQRKRRHIFFSGICNATVEAGHRYVCPEKLIYGRRSSSSFSFHRGSTPGCVGALRSTSGRGNGSVSSTFSPFPEDAGWPGCFCVGGVDGCVPAFRAPFCPCCFCPDGNPPFCCCFCRDGLLFLEEDGPRVCAPAVLPFFDPDASVESTMVGPPCPLRCKGGDSSFDRRSRSL